MVDVEAHVAPSLLVTRQLVLVASSVLEANQHQEVLRHPLLQQSGRPKPVLKMLMLRAPPKFGERESKGFRCTLGDHLGFNMNNLSTFCQITAHSPRLS